MDYGFTDAEILFAYSELKNRIMELAKTLGLADSVESDIKLYISVLQKIEEKHPNFKLSM